MYGFDFRSYRSIIDLKQEEVGQFDIICHVVAWEDLDTYDKNGKPGKKKPLTLVDDDGNELKCTLWSAFAQQFNDSLGTCWDHSKIIVVLHLAMMKIWDGNMCVQNAFNATKHSLSIVPNQSWTSLSSMLKSIVKGYSQTTMFHNLITLLHASRLLLITLLRRVLSHRFHRKISQNCWMWTRVLIQL